MHKELKVIGIVGGGKMGSSIFHYLTRYNYQLVWLVRSDSEKVANKYARRLKRSLKNDLITDEVYQNHVSNHRIVNDINLLSGCDLIIECINEDHGAKKDLIAQLFSIVNAEALILSNSSSILPNLLSDNIEYKKRIFGLHFFYPVEMKSVVELIVSTENQSKEIEKVKTFVEHIQMKCLEQTESNAFVMNRLMLHLQADAFHLSMTTGLTFSEIDSAVDEFLFPGGIFTIMDHVGYDLIAFSAKNYLKMEKDADKFIRLIEFLEGKDVLVVDLSIKRENVDQNLNKLDDKQIVQELVKSFYSNYNWYCENGYCESELLEFAMNQYLDTSIENWQKI